MAQLNSLLFSVHGLADPGLELSVQNQLAAIYTRLQEVVAMVSIAKKKETKTKPEQSPTLVTSSTSLAGDQSRQVEAGLSLASVTDEQKITKQLEEYQRALYKSSQKSEIGQYNPGITTKLLGSQSQNSPEPLKVDTVASRKNCEDSARSDSPRGEVSSALENLRRRASRDTLNLVEAVPEKRSRRLTPASSPQPTSSGSGRQSKSSGKGKILQIAVRVFRDFFFPFYFSPPNNLLSNEKK